MEYQPIVHVWINHDNDLVDLTLTTKAPARNTYAASETLHTNKKHPFLTIEQGFVPVGQLKLGMHVVEASGLIGEVTGWKSVPGTQAMYNLEIAQDHTYTVGAGQWVVHNCGTTGDPNPANLVDGQNNLYKGQQVNTDELLDRGWKLTRKDVGYVSDNFKDFLKSQGKNPADWKYYMETWSKGNAKIENHYWYNMWDSDFGAFHHH